MDTGAPTALWDLSAVQLRAQVSEATWNTCFADAVLVSASEQRLVLGVANSVIKERIEARFLSLLRSVLQEVAGEGEHSTAGTKSRRRLGVGPKVGISAAVALVRIGEAVARIAPGHVAARKQLPRRREQ